GEIVLLEDQDRTLWDRDMIAEGLALVREAMRAPQVGHYTVQAALASVHAEAPSTALTNWTRMVELYDALLVAQPSPVVALNRAVAVAMRDGPAAGLAIVDTLMVRGALARYHLAHAVRGELNQRLGRTAEARESFEAAL